MGDTSLWGIIVGIAFSVSLLFGFFGVLFFIDTAGGSRYPTTNMGAFQFMWVPCISGLIMAIAWVRKTDKNE